MVAMETSQGAARWVVVGIVSTGPAQCGLTPVIYHRVTSSLAWLSSILNTQH